MTPVTVAVYKVPGISTVPVANVRDAIELVGSSATVPTGLTQGDEQVKVKLAVPVIGATGSLNEATIMTLFNGTPVELFAGATADTVGAAMTTGGVTGTTVSVFKPNIGAWPPLPQAAKTAQHSSAPMIGMALLISLRLFILFLRLFCT